MTCGKIQTAAEGIPQHDRADGPIQYPARVCMVRDVAEWFYLDRVGAEFGPFLSSKMRAWFAHGHFPMGDLLLVRMRSWSRYMAVRDLFPDCAPFSCGIRCDQEPEGMQESSPTISDSVAEASTRMDTAEWFYLDKAGVQFGPFFSSKMRAWFAHGYFPMGNPLLVRIQSWNRYVTVKDLFPNCEPFAALPLATACQIARCGATCCEVGAETVVTAGMMHSSGADDGSQCLLLRGRVLYLRHSDMDQQAVDSAFVEISRYNLMKCISADTQLTGVWEPVPDSHSDGAMGALLDAKLAGMTGADGSVEGISKNSVSLRCHREDIQADVRSNSRKIGFAHQVTAAHLCDASSLPSMISRDSISQLPREGLFVGGVT